MRCTAVAKAGRRLHSTLGNMRKQAQQREERTGGSGLRMTRTAREEQPGRGAAPPSASARAAEVLAGFVTPGHRYANAINGLLLVGCAGFIAHQIASVERSEERVTQADKSFKDDAREATKDAAAD